jgi:Phospholipase C
MNKKLICATPIAIAAALSLYACGGDKVNEPDITSIKNVVVIYAENRSFDNLYGNFPGANGLQNVTAASATQVDRNGTVLATLPQVWNGLTQTGVTPVVTQAMTANLPNSPFAIDDPKASTRRSRRRRATCTTASTKTRCRSTAARTTSSPRGRIRAAW